MISRKRKTKRRILIYSVISIGRVFKHCNVKIFNVCNPVEFVLTFVHARIEFLEHLIEHGDGISVAFNSNDNFVTTAVVVVQNVEKFLHDPNPQQAYSQRAKRG